MKDKTTKTLYLLGIGSLLAGCNPNKIVEKEIGGKPNIIYILADDLGYGDLGCYNNESKIPTPNLDHLASQGMRFTDAHSPSAVCSPTRYGIITGQYCWRTHLKKGVLMPYDKPLIKPGQVTVASFLSD
jgi:arylsulfatase A